MTTLLPPTLLISLLLVASYTDIKYRKIPNILTYTGICSGLIFSVILSNSTTLQSSILGLITGFFLLLPLYIKNGVAAGDIKLLAMCGTYVGFPAILIAVLLSAVFGGLYALFTLLYFKFFQPTHLAPKHIPFAPSITCGIITSFADLTFLHPFESLLGI